MSSSRLGNSCIPGVLSSDLKGSVSTLVSPCSLQSDSGLLLSKKSVPSGNSGDSVVVDIADEAAGLSDMCDSVGLLANEAQ